MKFCSGEWVLVGGLNSHMGVNQATLFLEPMTQWKMFWTCVCTEIRSMVVSKQAEIPLFFCTMLLRRHFCAVPLILFLATGIFRVSGWAGMPEFHHQLGTLRWKETARSLGHGARFWTGCNVAATTKRHFLEFDGNNWRWYPHPAVVYRITGRW